MTEDNTVQKIKRWKPMFKRPVEKPKTRWEDGVLGDKRNMNVKTGKCRTDWRWMEEVS
jgi:hypothetical protein